MDKFFDAIGTGLGYIDQGVQLYGNVFGGGGNTQTIGGVSIPPFNPYPSGGATTGSSSSSNNMLGGIDMTTLALIGVAILLLKK